MTASSAGTFSKAAELIAAREGAAEVAVAATLTLVNDLTLRLELEAGWRSQGCSGHEEGNGDEELHLVTICKGTHTLAHASPTSKRKEEEWIL